MNTAVMLLSMTLFQADFTVCNVANNQQHPTAIFQNNQYYVFWQDERSTPIYALCGARISAAGAVLDPNGKILFRDSAYMRPAVAHDGASFLVAFRNHC